MARSRRERIIADFNRIREELEETLKDCKPEEFDWKPRPDMKSVKEMLRECGIAEKVLVTLVRDGEMPPWEGAVSWSGEDLESTIRDLETIRQETLQFLEDCSDDDLDRMHTLRAGRELEGEDILRSIARHEYYHLGQIIYNRWLLGYNPYQQSSA